MRLLVTKHTYLKVFLAIGFIVLLSGFAFNTIRSSYSSTFITFKFQFPDGTKNVGTFTSATATNTSTRQIFIGIVNPDSGIVVFETFSVGIKRLETAGFTIGHAFPNPSHDGQQTIPISINEPGDFTLEYFDISGRIAISKTFIQAIPGNYAVQVNGLTRGIYFYRAIINGAISDGGKTVITNGGSGNIIMSELVFTDYKPNIKNLNSGNRALFQFEFAGENFEDAEYSYEIETDTDSTFNKVLYEKITSHSGRVAVFSEADTLQMNLMYESPYGVVGYSMIDVSPELMHEIVDGNKLRLYGADDDVNGKFTDSLNIEAPLGTIITIPVTATIRPRADISFIVKDAVFETPEEGIGISISGAKKAVSDSNGFVKVQIDIRGYNYLKTDTLGTGMLSTEWNLGNVGTDDEYLGVVPVVYNNETMPLLIDVVGAYGISDRATYAHNEKFNPNIKHDSLPEGTLKTLYVNLVSSRALHEVTYNNLKKGVEFSKVANGDEVRLQDPDVADREEIDVSSDTEEYHIINAFGRGEKFQDYDYLVLLASHSTVSVNAANANLVEGYSTKGYALIRVSDFDAFEFSNK